MTVYPLIGVPSGYEIIAAFFVNGRDDLKDNIKLLGNYFDEVKIGGVKPVTIFKNFHHDWRVLED